LVIAVEIDGASRPLSEILRDELGADCELVRRSLLRAMASQRLHGEVLIHEFHVSPEIVDRALRRQLVHRLDALDGLLDARVSFRVAVKVPRGALCWNRTAQRAAPANGPLGPRDFLHGRRRARARVAATHRVSAGRSASTPQSAPVLSISPCESALRALGLAEGAGVPEIKRAYRRLARELHPDLHPGATDGQRRLLAARFHEVTEAYRALV
jgi:hypothetical protein